jgi:hypothetical protein
MVHRAGALDQVLLLAGVETLHRLPQAKVITEDQVRPIMQHTPAVAAGVEQAQSVRMERQLQITGMAALGLHRQLLVHP